MSVETPVLIVGGGPVGFTIALDLARRGVQSTLIERDAGTALELLAKAGTLNERSMEYCRWLGISEAIINIGFPDDHPRDTVYCTSLNGFVLGRDPMPSTRDRTPPPQTPEMLRKCPQHLFDPLLAEAVARTGKVDVRYRTSFHSLVQDSDGVTARLESSTGDPDLTIRSQYLIGCDGAGSSVRQAVGIPFEGKQLDYSVSIMIEVDGLEKYHPLGVGERYMFVGTEGTWANLTAVDGHNLYRLTMVGSEEKLMPGQLDVDALVRRAFGRDDVPYRAMRVMPWRRSQFAASTFRRGRVLLAGDAAHTMSPTGGHGLNTGLGDAADLSWMLAALVDGWGAPALLDAYSTERRATAIRNSAFSTRNYGVWVQTLGRDRVLEDSQEGESQRQAIGAQMSAMLQQEWWSLGVGMGHHYDESPIVVPDGTPAPIDDASQYIQTARPGHRAPHAWLPDGRSTLDLFGDRFTLLRLGEDAPDAADFVSAASRLGLPLSVVSVDQPDIAELYERRLVLVRPDGMVAWRADTLPTDPSTVIDIVRGASVVPVASGPAAR
jgi:2-polyprenyl-6-methoxyphenol hydroxylase-like FAD-dependent oxidoreductase